MGPGSKSLLAVRHDSNNCVDDDIWGDDHWNKLCEDNEMRRDVAFFGFDAEGRGRTGQLVVVSRPSLGESPHGQWWALDDFDEGS